MTDNVVDLANRRSPVFYTVRIMHYWDGTVEVQVEDIADDDRSRSAAADALRKAAELFERPRSETTPT